MPEQARSLEKRARILEAAMRLFAEKGYEAARVEDLAAGLGIAKGSVFQHFGSKEGLFLAAYRRAVESLPRYLDAPAAVRAPRVLRHPPLLARAHGAPAARGLHPLPPHPHRQLRQRPRPAPRDQPLPGPGGPLRDRGLREPGPRAGELRRDVDAELVASVLEWTVERFQDALLAEELFPGFMRRGPRDPARTKKRIAEFVRVLEDAIGARRRRVAGPRSRGRRPARRPPQRRAATSDHS